MRHIDHHDLDPPSPNLQHVGGVLFGLTRGTNSFLLDSCSILLKAINARSSKPLPFQTHLKLAQELFTLGLQHVCPLKVDD